MNRLWLASFLLAAAACGGSHATPTSPSSPMPTPTPTPTPNVQGQYVGTYGVSGCSDDGYLVGTCAGLVGVSGQITLSLMQNQDAVTGTVTLGPLGIVGTSGTFQGSVTPSGNLSGSATLDRSPWSFVQRHRPARGR